MFQFRLVVVDRTAGPTNVRVQQKSTAGEPSGGGTGDADSQHATSGAAGLQDEVSRAAPPTTNGSSIHLNVQQPQLHSGSTSSAPPLSVVSG
jgi:hypothetical protein